jgi:hypothetical protein
LRREFEKGRGGRKSHGSGLFFESAVISAAIEALKTLPASFHPALCRPECHFVPEIGLISERLSLVSNDRILFGRVLSIRLGGEKVKNMHGTKEGFSIPFWSGKDTMDRPAADMERNDKKGCLSVLFWQTPVGDFCAYWQYRAMVALSLLLGSAIWRQSGSCGKGFSGGPRIRAVQGRLGRCGCKRLKFSIGSKAFLPQG